MKRLKKLIYIALLIASFMIFIVEIDKVNKAALGAIGHWLDFILEK